MGAESSELRAERPIFEVEKRARTPDAEVICGFSLRSGLLALNCIDPARRLPVGQRARARSEKPLGFLRHRLNRSAHVHAGVGERRTRRLSSELSLPPPAVFAVRHGGKKPDRIQQSDRRVCEKRPRVGWNSTRGKPRLTRFLANLRSRLFPVSRGGSSVG